MELFRSFEKYQISPKNSKRLASSFTEKRKFETKNCQKSIFFRHATHIPIHLDIKMFYVIILGILKNIKILLKI
jgi:hypothetical protein